MNTTKKEISIYNIMIILRVFLFIFTGCLLLLTLSACNAITDRLRLMGEQDKTKRDEKIKQSELEKWERLLKS